MSRPLLHSLSHTDQRMNFGLSSPDSTPLLRLFTHYRSGHTKIFLLVHGLAGWMVEKKPYNATHDSLIDPIASFVLDGTSGEELKPNADRLIGPSCGSLLSTRLLVDSFSLSKLQRRWRLATDSRLASKLAHPPREQLQCTASGLPPVAEAYAPKSM